LAVWSRVASRIVDFVALLPKVKPTMMLIAKLPEPIPQASTPSFSAPSLVADQVGNEEHVNDDSPKNSAFH